MRPVLAISAALGLAACMEGAETASSTSQEIAIGRQMLIFFESGYDEPPVSFTIISCGAGRCVSDGAGDTAPLQQVSGGYVIEIYDATYTLTPTGSGFVDPPSGDILGISWLTERSA